MTKIKTILVPVDFSTPSRAALQSAACLAEKYGSSLIVLYVAESSRSLDNVFSANPQMADTDLRTFVDEEVEELVPVKFQIASGKAWVRIVEAAKNLGVDLIVTGTHGEGGLTHALLGSTAERVVRHAPCSTLIVHPGRSLDLAKRRAAMKILVPLDFSAQSKSALEQAAGWAKKFDAKIDLLHVTPSVVSLASYQGIDFSPLQEQWQAVGKKMLQTWNTRLRARKIAGQPVLSSGRPANEIIAQAKKSGTDLIVISTHGYTGLEHALMGSTAEQVVRQAPCPVLVVRPPIQKKRR